MTEERTKTPYILSLRDKILETAMHAFAQKGIKAVRMDDIAQSLSISKRTLYEIYDNKEKLLYEGVKKYKELKEEEFAKVYAESKTVMDVIIYLYRVRVEEFRATNPLFYAEIGKYPSVVKYFESDQQQSHQRFIGFLKRGADEGYFRSNVDLELVGVIFNAIGEYVLSHQLYRSYSIEQLFRDLLLVSLRGICTNEGVRFLDQHFG